MSCKTPNAETSKFLSLELKQEPHYSKSVNPIYISENVTIVELKKYCFKALVSLLGITRMNITH